MIGQPKIKILVGYHRPATLLKSDIYVPIHLGRAVAREKSKDGVLSEQGSRWLHDNMIGDDTGDNISSRNRVFCELTGIYWAWKNYEALGNPDYVGFMHYRRIFDFKQESENYPINENLNLPQIESLSEQMGIWDSEFIRGFIRDHEYIVSKHHNANPVAHFMKSKWCREEDLHLAVEAIESVCPEFSPYAKEYLSRNEIIFFSSFILPKAAFFRYADFIFKILFHLEDKIDLYDETYHVERRRAPARLAEQLTGMFFTYLGSKCCVTELPIIYIEHPELKNVGEIYFQEEGVLPIVFTTDKNYYLYIGVAIQSIIENKSNGTKYDILILETGLTIFEKEKLEDLAKDDVHIHVLDVAEICKEYKLNELMAINHLSQAAYIRLLLCEILKNYHKVIYLDCDLVVLTDLSEIYYGTDLSRHYAAVVKDYLIGSVFINRPEFVQYMEEVLHVDDLSMYFNSGVMIFNLDLMRTDKIQDKLLKTALVNNKFFHDQNVLNSVLYKKVVYLNGAYNVNYFLYFDLYRDAMPESYFEEFRKPKILHYASGNKPWRKPGLPAADIFWRYARLTPLYEEIVYTNLVKNAVIASDTSVYRDILKKVIHYRKSLFKLYCYRLLSIVTFGKIQKKYLAKKRDIKGQIRTVRQLFK